MKLLDIVNTPWCIVPSYLQEIQNIYITHLRGEKIDIKGVEERIGKKLKNETKRYDIAGNVAIIPVHGVIAKRMNLFSEISGGVSTELIGKDFAEAVNNPDVKSIILNVDSPGGAADGVPELANMVYQSRGKKPIITITNGTMASGAYWIGAAADAMLITSNVDMVGSIGVVASHIDVSNAADKMGIKTTEIYAGKYKRIASQYAPLSAEGKQSIQEMVDYMFSVFVEDIAKFRGISVDKVLNEMSTEVKHLFIGQQAVKAGLVDGVSTLDRLVTDLNAAGDKSVLTIGNKIIWR